MMEKFSTKLAMWVVSDINCKVVPSSVLSQDATKCQVEILQRSTLGGCSMSNTGDFIFKTKVYLSPMQHVGHFFGNARSLENAK